MKPRKTYDWRWAKLSHQVLKQQPVCDTPGCGRPSAHVDHITPVKVAPWRRLDRTNLHGVCQACHNRITAAYERGTIRGACDNDGNTLDPGHPWAQADNATAIEVVNARPMVSPQLAAILKRKAVRK
jgi:hypothetical protein